jgi:hypothetical protein
MPHCKDCHSSFAFHELREERCLNCWHLLTTGNPLPPDARQELAERCARAEAELDVLKASFKLELDAAKQKALDLRHYLQMSQGREAKLREACQVFVEWLDREEAGPPVKIDHNSEAGRLIWREWFYGNMDLCGRAQELGRVALQPDAKPTDQSAT